VPATGESPSDGDGERQEQTRDAVRTALDRLPNARARWYAGADHDLHAQHPERLAADLANLADLAELAGLPTSTGPAADDDPAEAEAESAEHVISAGRTRQENAR
jgi:hypothetical protein